MSDGPEFFRVVGKDGEPGALLQTIEKIVNDPEFAQIVANASARLAAGLPVKLPDGSILMRGKP
jgi:hypothetical protein